MSEQRQSLSGSARRAVPDGRVVGWADPASAVEVTVVLRRRGELPAGGEEPLTREQLTAAAGADPDDVELVRRTLTDSGMTVTGEDVASRRVQARGDLATLERIFGTSLELVESPAPAGEGTVTHRQRTGDLSLPGPLAEVVVAVLGLDDRPQARARFRPAAAASTSYTAPQLGGIYRFPTGTTGAGHSLAIVELGGGYTDADLRPTGSASVSPRRRASRPWVSTAPATPPKATRLEPTGRCCWTSRWPARSLPGRPWRSTSRPTPTAASSMLAARRAVDDSAFNFRTCG